MGWGGGGELIEVEGLSRLGLINIFISEKKGGGGY